MQRAWLLPVGGALLAPFVTWWPMLASKAPWLGLPPYPPAEGGLGGDLWSSQAFWLVALAVLAVIIGTDDRALGLAVALAGLSIFWRGNRLDPTHSVLFACGALMLVAMRRTPRAWHPRITSVLCGLGIFELAYVLHQWAGYDLFWGTLYGLRIKPPVQPLGTLSTVDAAGAYLAITAPLMPWWLLPFVAFAVWFGQSAGALAAFITGLTVRFGLQKGWRHPATLASAVVGLGGFYWLLHTKSATTMLARLLIWQFSTQRFISAQPDLATSTARHVFGLGLGGWKQTIPALQVQHQFVPHGELWQQAHSEPLQWVFETGLIGLVLLACWLYAHRTMFVHPVWGGSIAALSVNSLTFFPLHVVQLALVALIIVGLATAPERTIPTEVGRSSRPTTGRQKRDRYDPRRG